MRNKITFAVVVAALAMASCSVPPLTFEHGDEIDAPAVDMAIDSPGTPMLVVSSTDVTVAEAGNTTVTVNLDRQPSAAVLVTVMSTNSVKVGVTPTALLFDTGNWQTPQTLTISGKEDVDVEDEHEMVSITSSIGNVDVGVTVNDNDGLGIAVMPSAGLDVTEGSTAPLTVHLTAQPSSPVMVNVASSDLTAATVSPAMLTFTSANWNLDQTVVVSGVQDVDILDASASIMFTGTGLADVSVPVTVIDDDVLGITPSTTNLGTLNEGGTANFTVRLSQQPPGNVSVTVVSSDPSILVVAPSPLDFTTVNWNNPQTVTVTLPQDADTTDDTATITLAATGLTSRTVSASIHDDDVMTIVANPIPFLTTEGTSANLNVRLSNQPAADITLDVSSLNTNVVTVGPATLTFTAANWNTNQPVMVAAPEDADAAAGLTSIHLESLPDSLSTDIPVTVTDNDQLLITTSTNSLTLGEGGTMMFGVKLTAMPAASVVVNVSSNDTTAATVMQPTLTFTTANWNSFQQVMVSGVDDLDLADESLVVNLVASGLPGKTVDVTVTDDDMQQVLMSSPSISVNESGTGTIGVSLKYMPPGPVSVTVMSGDSNKATVMPTTLNFTTGNYATPQIVTVTGVHDANANDDTTTITASAPMATSGTTTVTVNDIDVLSIETSQTTVTVAEGSTVMFGVRLTAQPAGPTTVMLASTDTGAATIGSASVMFTTSNWNSFQNVTVTGVQDADAANESLSINLTSPPLSMRTVTVTVTDDEVLGIATTVPSLTVGEGTTGMFGVHLTAQPAADTVVSVVSMDTSSATVNPAMLTFTMSNYAADQMVTITGVEDVDLASPMVNINLTSPPLTPRAVVATMMDNDAQIVVASASSVTVGEGASTTVGFHLMYQPAGNVMVTVTPTNPAVATVTGGTLTFNSSNYAANQNVTVNGAQDNDAVNNSTTLTASASGATSATVTANVTDDDTLGIQTDTMSLMIGEAGSGMFGVRLTAAPVAPATITVMIGSSDSGAASSPTTMLTFDSANWNVYQTVVVNGVNDPDPNNEGVTFTVSSSGLPSKTVSVTVTDDDPQLIVVTPTTVNLGEAGSTTYNVHLSAMPSGNVVVTSTSLDTTAATIGVSSAMLTFTSLNYATDQPVTVNGAQDVDLVNEVVTINVTSPGLTTVPVTANVTDDDTQVVVASASPIAVTEGMSTTVGFHLMYQPTVGTTVTVTPTSSAVATVSGSPLSFTAGDYMTNKTVTVTGAQDNDAVGNSTTLTASASGATSAVVTVNVTDDDTLGIQTDVPSVTIGEAGSGSFRVRLTAAPVAPATITVNIASTDTGAATVTAATQSLVFDSTNWNTYQTVNVNGVNDLDPNNEAVDFTLMAGGLPTQHVTVNVTDDDPQIIVVSASSINLGEAGSATYNVHLTAQPTSNVVVTSTSLDTGAVSINPVTGGMLTFNSSNYLMDQTVTVNGVADQDLANESVTIQVTSPGLTTQNVTANVTDDDTQVVLMSSSAVTVAENGNTTVGVTLQYIPTGTTMVSVVSNDATIASVSPSSLSFTAADYNMPHNITITGLHDVNTVLDTTFVRASATGATSGTTTVMVTDIDVLAIQTDLSSLTFSETGTGTIQVRLSNLPQATVNVNLSWNNPAYASMTQGFLQFTTSNWNVYQPVNFTGIHDNDPIDESGLLGLVASGLTTMNIPVTIRDVDPPTLILSEVVPGNSSAEYVEIYNPWPIPVSLHNYYITDYPQYFRLPVGGLAPQSGDFVAQFPTNTTIAPNQVISIAIQGPFEQNWGQQATFKLANAGGSGQPMIQIANGGTPNLQETGEFIMLFYWDQVSDLVKDDDMVVWGFPSGQNVPVNKGGFSQDGPDADTISTSYFPDLMNYQNPTQSISGMFAVRRTMYEDNHESVSGGNGLFGHDETSENMNGTFTYNQFQGSPNVTELPPIF